MSGRGRGDSREPSGLKGAGESDGEEILVISNQHSPTGCHSVLLRVVPPPLFSSFFPFGLFLSLCTIPSSSSGCSSTFVQFPLHFPVVPLRLFNSCSPSGCSSTFVQLPVLLLVVPLPVFNFQFPIRLFLFVQFPVPLPVVPLPVVFSYRLFHFVQFPVSLPVVPLPLFNFLFPCRLFLYLCSVFCSRAGCLPTCVCVPEVLTALHVPAALP